MENQLLTKNTEITIDPVIISQRPKAGSSLYEDSHRFISYIKGNDKSKEKTILPMGISSYIAQSIDALCPIKALSKVTYTSADRLDVVIDDNENTGYGWVTNDLIKDNDTRTSISKISIHLHQLFAKPKVAHSVLEDASVKVEEFIRDRIAIQMAAAENKAFLYGNGVSEPQGILKCPISENHINDVKYIQGLVCGTKEKIEHYTKIIELMELLPTKYLHGAAWIMSRNAASYIRTLRDESTGRFLWQTSLIHGTPDTLLGYPVILSDDMPKMGQIFDKGRTYPVLFANLYEGYQIAEKPQISILRDPYNVKPFIEFYATKRIGAEVMNTDAIKAMILEG